MIPVCLVTGFLGAGKTTFLRHLADRYRGRKIVFLVNEFSGADIDGALLANAAEDVVSLPGGSIFCKCLVSEFSRVLGMLPQRFQTPDSPIEGLVIEASGIANPKVVEHMFRETRLDAVYALRTIIAIADPGTFPTLVQTLPNILAQIEACDLVLLNKTDCFSEPELAATEMALRTIRPEVPVFRTQYGATGFDPFLDHGFRNLRGAYAECADPHYAAFNVKFVCDMPLEVLLEKLRALPGLYRAKGFVRVQGAFHYVDCTAAQCTTHPIPNVSGNSTLALIVDKQYAAQVQVLIKQLMC